MMTVAARAAVAKQAGKVALLGAAGGIGQPLALLLKDVPHIKHLALYDISSTAGLAADLSHICTQTKITAHSQPEQLDACLQGAETVVIPAGVPRKPGMTRDDLFNVNAKIVYTLASACAKNCPDANILVISNPVNSTVPIVAETLRLHGVYNKRRLFGVTTLDVVRARTFVAEALATVQPGLDPATLDVPVYGGHSGVTIIPVLSQTAIVRVGATPVGLDVPRLLGASSGEGALERLTKRVQFGGDEVVAAKAGAGSATLSMAYAAREFVEALQWALHGKSLAGATGRFSKTQCAFVECDLSGDARVPYMATRVTLSADGVGKIHALGKMSAYEEKLFKASLPELAANIAKGVEFVKAQQKSQSPPPSPKL